MRGIYSITGGMGREEPSTLEIMYYVERLTECYGKMCLLDKMAAHLVQYPSAKFLLLDQSTSLPDAVDRILSPPVMPSTEKYVDKTMKDYEQDYTDEIGISSIPETWEKELKYLVKDENSLQHSQDTGEVLTLEEFARKSNMKRLKDLSDEPIHMISEPTYVKSSGQIYNLTSPEKLSQFFKKFRRLKRPNLYAPFGDRLILLYNHYGEDALTLRSLTVNSPFAMNLQGSGELLDVILSEPRKREEHTWKREEHEWRREEHDIEMDRLKMARLKEATELGAAISNVNLDPNIRRELENQTLNLIRGQRLVNRAIGSTGQLDKHV